MKIVVVGRGFIGSAVISALRARGHDVSTVPAPRYRTAARDVRRLLEEAKAVPSDFAGDLNGVHAVVNCAGMASPLDSLTDDLVGANALLPLVLAAVVEGQTNGARLLHVSSAAVQGAGVLDESRRLAPFSAYSRTKALAESGLALAGSPVTIYRPASVHGPGRPLTESLTRFARSAFSSVGGSGTAISPVAHVTNVADGIAFTIEQANPPAIVLHPSDGLTCAEVLTTLGGKEPIQIPIWLAQSVLWALARGARFWGRLAATARRLEVTWLGQTDDALWLHSAGWAPIAGAREWAAMGDAERANV